MKVCAVEKFDDRGGGHRPTFATASAAAAMLDRARVFAPSTRACADHETGTCRGRRASLGARRMGERQPIYPTAKAWHRSPLRPRVGAIRHSSTRPAPSGGRCSKPLRPHTSAASGMLSMGRSIAAHAMRPFFVVGFLLLFSTWGGHAVHAQPAAGAAPHIEWEVKNRFRLFRNEADFQRHV